jgi:hypothetical protein
MATHQRPPTEGVGYNGYRIHTKDRVYRANGYGDNGYTYYPVVIVGAGESGICMAYKLKQKLGVDQFRIFERQSGIGGTWWINRYPGVACDIPAAFYSFSFSPNPKWAAFYPPGPEIYDYLQDVCDKYGLTDKIQLNTDVESCRWLADEEEWEITVQHLVPGTGDLSEKDRENRVHQHGEYSVYVAKEIVRCKVLVSGVGALVRLKSPPSSLNLCLLDLPLFSQRSNPKHSPKFQAQTFSKATCSILRDGTTTLISRTKMSSSSGQDAALPSSSRISRQSDSGPNQSHNSCDHRHGSFRRPLRQWETSCGTNMLRLCSPMSLVS